MQPERLSREEAERLCGSAIPEKWEITPVYRQALAGFFIVCGNEIHAFRSPEFSGTWLVRGDLERLTEPLFKQYGPITTSVRVENLCGHRFVQRLGFRACGEDGRVVFYRAERLRHARL